MLKILVFLQNRYFLGKKMKYKLIYSGFRKFRKLITKNEKTFVNSIF